MIASGIPLTTIRTPYVGLVSVIVPCRNERDYIGAFCDAVLGQILPPDVTLEVLIADGRSDDGTREWLLQFCAQPQRENCRFILVDNPQRITSSALNRCIEHAQGGVIVRLDVHSVYAADYIAQCLITLSETGADNVGGPWRAEGVGLMQKAVAAAFQSRWVSGGARSRQLDYNGWVDTVYLGCWPLYTFKRFGGFDESLVRNQDDEHNLRIERGGGNVWQSSRIRSTYRPRSKLGDVFRQWMQYGYWKPFVIKKFGRSASIRHVVPAAFVALLGLGLLGTLCLWAPAIWALAALLAAYALYLLMACWDIRRALRSNRSPQPAAILLRVPAVILAYHFGYGLGSWRGWWDAVVRRRADPAFARLTR